MIFDPKPNLFSQYTGDISSFAKAITGRAPEMPPFRPCSLSTGNEVWDISSVKEPLILRITSADKIDVYLKEAWCIKAAGEAGVPSAQVFDVGIYDNSAWMLQSKILGVAGSEWQGDPLWLWREIGRLSAQLHTIQVTGYGADMWPIRGTIQNPIKTWAEWLDKTFEQLFSDGAFVSGGILTTAQYELAREQLNQLYKLEFKPVLIHGDIFPKNTMIRYDKVVHAIDYELAYGGNGVLNELALISLLETPAPFIRAFCHGYGLSEDQVEAMQPALSQMALLRAAFFVRRAHDCNFPDKSRRFGFMSRMLKEDNVIDGLSALLPLAAQANIISTPII